MDDKQMIQSPEEWPRWPVLPLKRKPKGADMQFGLIVAQEGWYSRTGSIRVFLDVPMYSKPDFSKVRWVAYDNADGLVADGWIVD